MKTDTLAILVLCGSLRRHSLNKALADSLPELASPTILFTAAPAIGDLPHYNADIQEGQGFPKQLDDLAAAVAASDALIIVSPEYNFSVPGALKNALDWLSRLSTAPLRDKPVLLQSASTSMLGGSRMQYHLRQILVSLEANVFTKPEVFVTLAKEKFDPNTGRLADETTRKMVSAQLAAFENFVRRRDPRERT